ncbi:iron-regulated ABC transporter permease protein SufD [Propionicimonas paludicola]|uniref:Iron-regulated ABC transporter permease protein SufD n=1 Tax=Propionicimonas paludicola TaxID=185243 RepID=A0A2A9CRD0_9ACTN|nr:Fe-S cluster assembly protein SufD [Propionicimonas paludicola]PFG16928.1 iron-regulated ABC transporter permease protein SufD [Propionicimonas paludicola]
MTVTTAVPNVAEAVETVASHLHPVASFDLADHPVPNGREEVWRFTPLRRLHGLLDGLPSQAHLNWSANSPAGVTRSELDTAAAIALGVPAPVDRPSALAVAQAGGAVLFDVAPGVELDEPLVIELSGDDPTATVYGQVIFRIGANAGATIVLRHTGSVRYVSSVSLLVGDGANLNFVGLQDWAADTVHLGHIGMRIGRDARVRTVAASLGGDLVRLVETAEYDGPGGELEQFGLYFVDAGQHIEHRMFVDHNQPSTRSKVDYRGALQGQDAHSVWVGDVLIRKVAEGINTYESNKNLVLTDGCRADSVPNLEIETGQIEGAGHSSTTGRFDDEQLFYLRSRGIPEDEARRLVVHGFFVDIIRRVGVPEVEQRLLAAVEKELELVVGTPEAVTS